uniref:Uncharacterized protein n=1 Tax=Oryzias latipes TaxID=8090 RepID=A0A3P9KBX3_ORYLA
MLSRMLGLLINNLHLVEKLAESRPIRRAAQITAYAITKAQIVGQDTSKRVLQSETLRQLVLKYCDNFVSPPGLKEKNGESVN